MALGTIPYVDLLPREYIIFFGLSFYNPHLDEGLQYCWDFPNVG